MDLNTIGKVIVLLGAVLLLVGGSILLMKQNNINLEQFLGGIRFEIGNLRCSFFLVGSILLSVILTVVLNLIVHFLNK